MRKTLKASKSRKTLGISRITKIRMKMRLSCLVVMAMTFSITMLKKSRKIKNRSLKTSLMKKAKVVKKETKILDRIRKIWSIETKKRNITQSWS